MRGGNGGRARVVPGQVVPGRVVPGRVMGDQVGLGVCRRRLVGTVVGAVAVVVLAVVAAWVVSSLAWWDLSLIDGPLPLVLGGGGLAGLVAVLLAGRGRRWWQVRVPVCVAVAGGVVAAAAAALTLWQPWPDALPPVVWAATAAAVLGLTVAVAAAARRTGWGRRLVAVAAAALVVLGAAAQVNAYFAQFPTPRALFGLPPAGQVDFTGLHLSPHLAPTSGTAPAAGTAAGTGQALPLAARWRPPADLPTAGVVSTVAIPGTVSGFAARPAWVYLPPAALVRNPPALPVLVLLHGQPGSPRDWIDAGQVPATMDRYATAHAGLAPVVVMPDPLGSALANPLCLDSRLGNAQSYLARDVPAWVQAHLPVNTDPRSWAIAGLSEGGTCSWQLAVNAPRTYPTFLDISGQAEPTLGSRARTIASAYGGDAAAFDRVNPAAVLAQQRFPGTTGIIVVGSGDGLYRPQARIVADLCRRAGIDVHYQEVPGGHDWRVWSNGLRTSLPLLTQRLRLV